MKKKYLAAGAAGAAAGALGSLVAWKFLTRQKDTDWNDVADKVQHSEHSHFVEIDGATVHYQEFGDKTAPTMLLIHGYTASTYVWHTVAPLFADSGFHVIALDLLGFGYSDKPAWFEYSIVAQARIVERLMDRLGIGRATLIGSSYGGAVASTVALDYGERVEKLILVDAVINDEVKNSSILKFSTLAGLGEIITPFLLDSKSFMRRRMKETLAPSNHHLITEERVDSVHRPLNAADAHRSVLSSARNWNADRIEEDAYLINHPTLLIWGKDDKIIPLHNGEKLHQEILNSRLVVLKDCGHVPQEEKPEQFVEIVAEFCRDKKS